MRALFAAALALMGCSAGHAAATGNDAGGVSMDDGGGMTPAPPPLTCLGVFQCVTTNSCMTDACVNDCMAKGSADSQAEVTNLATCNQNHSCMDATCLQANCKTELEACVSGSQPTEGGGQPGDGAAPMGTVPASLVGSWSFADGYDTASLQSWTFNADGTAKYATSLSGGFGGCDNLNLDQQSGTVVADDTTITFYATSHVATTDTCGVMSTSTEANEVSSYTYSFNMDGTLKIVDSTCAAKYTGYDTSIGLYCTGNYTKQ